MRRHLKQRCTSYVCVRNLWNSNENMVFHRRHIVDLSSVLRTFEPYSGYKHTRRIDWVCIRNFFGFPFFFSDFRRNRLNTRRKSINLLLVNSERKAKTHTRRRGGWVKQRKAWENGATERGKITAKCWRWKVGSKNFCFSFPPSTGQTTHRGQVKMMFAYVPTSHTNWIQFDMRAKSFEPLEDAANASDEFIYSFFLSLHPAFPFTFDHFNSLFGSFMIGMGVAWMFDRIQNEWKLIEQWK